VIIKIRPNGSDFGGCLSYLLNKPRGAEPEVIDQNMPGRTAGDFADQMQSIADRGRRHRAGPVLHAIVSWHKDDRVSSEQMNAVVHGLMSHLTIDPEQHQYVTVQHRDEDEPHLHLVVNRVGIDGSLFVGEHSGRKADVYREHCEQEYGWIVARGRGDREAPPQTQPEIHYERRLSTKTAKNEVHQAVKGAVALSDGTFDSFVTQCQIGGRVVPDLSFNEGGFNGASFTLMSHLREGEPEVNDQGEPFVFKGSQIAWGKDALEEALYERRRELSNSRGNEPLPGIKEIRATRGPRPAQNRSRSSAGGSGPGRRPRQHFLIKSDRKGLPVFRFKPPWSNLSATARMFDQIFNGQLSAASAHRLRARPRPRGM